MGLLAALRHEIEVDRRRFLSSLAAVLVAPREIFKARKWTPPEPLRIVVDCRKLSAMAPEWRIMRNDDGAIVGISCTAYTNPDPSKIRIVSMGDVV